MVMAVEAMEAEMVVAVESMAAEASTEEVATMEEEAKEKGAMVAAMEGARVEEMAGVVTVVTVVARDNLPANHLLHP